VLLFVNEIALSGVPHLSHYFISRLVTLIPLMVQIHEEVKAKT